MVMSLSRKNNIQSTDQVKLEAQISRQNAIIAQQSGELSDLKNQTTKDEMESTENSDEQESDIKNTTEQDTESETETEKDSDKNSDEETTETRVYFTKHVVERGESLSSICKKYGVDYGASYRIILTLNGIEDPDAIYVGQVILLPIE
jgi:LysM repeat protein